MQSVNVKLDDQCADIMANVPDILRNSAINLAIKMFAETDIYYKYFAEKVEEFEEPKVTVTHEQPQQQSQQSPQQPPISTTTWDAF